MRRHLFENLGGERRVNLDVLNFGSIAGRRRLAHFGFLRIGLLRWRCVAKKVRERRSNTSKNWPQSAHQKQQNQRQRMNDRIIKADNSDRCTVAATVVASALLTSLGLSSIASSACHVAQWLSSDASENCTSNV
jgi:hypothetical protein